MTAPDTRIHHRRRQDLMAFMDGGVAVLPTAPQVARNADVKFPFRPDSDFYYLTHFPEPEAVAVLVPGRPEGEFILFCRERDAKHEAWEGRLHGLDGARQTFGADQSFGIGELDKRMPGLLQNRERVFVSMGKRADFDADILRWVGEIRGRQRAGVDAPGEFVHLGRLLHEMRVIKSKDEVQLMRRAARLTAAAHRRAMRVAAPGKYEYQIQAELECEFRLQGSEWPAYPSIVAGGENACILHYTDNRRRLESGDLLLIDAGAEVDCYAADVTRTFPVNGKFSDAQRAVYEVVLAAQKVAIDAARPEAPMNAYYDAANAALLDGLIDLGLLRGAREQLLEKDAARQFTMHRAGHYLGMDVHDVGDYKIDGAWRQLEPGMALTVEPGIYIKPAPGIDPKWHNIGVRIEDDIVVTRAGNEVLSADAPKEIADIEAACAGDDGG